MEVPDDISRLTNPLIGKFPNTMAESLIGHANFRYDDISVRNKGSCLGFNLFGICSDTKC